MSLIKINNLTKKYPDSNEIVLNNISLAVEEGDFVAVMGRSGCGKSTLINCLSGMATPDSGEIFLDGTNLVQLKEQRMANIRNEKIGFVFQNFNLIDSMTVLENLLTAGYLKKGVKQKEIEKRSKSLLNSVEMGKYTKSFPNKLSGGQKQRVAVARALINNPKILFADEPTGALNSSAGQNILKLLTNKNEEGQTICLVTHDLKAASRANRVIYLQDGAVIDELSLGRYTDRSNEGEQELQIWLQGLGW